MSNGIEISKSVNSLNVIIDVNKKYSNYDLEINLHPANGLLLLSIVTATKFNFKKIIYLINWKRKRHHVGFKQFT